MNFTNERRRACLARRRLRVVRLLLNSFSGRVTIERCGRERIETDGALNDVVGGVNISVCIGSFSSRSVLCTGESVIRPCNNVRRF